MSLSASLVPCALLMLALALQCVCARDLSPPPGPPPAPHPEFPQDPPADPRCSACRWGADVGGGSADTRGHLQPLGAHAAPSGRVEELEALPTPAELYARSRANEPFVVRGGIRDQRPLHEWSDEYMARAFGDTKVDVEFEKKEDRFGAFPESWSLRRFLSEKDKPSNRESLYVVHDLTPAMRREWRAPRPLSCREVRMQMLVMWFSSGGTVSVLHNDGQENFLTLLAGRKKLLLFDQEQAHNLYADEARKSGTSPIDVDAVDMELFPRAAQLKYREVELRKGDMLYIPKWHWHQVRSSTQPAEEQGGALRNLAVNFWWHYAPDRDQEKGHPRGPWWGVAAAKRKWPLATPCTALPHGAATMAHVRIATQSSGEEQDLHRVLRELEAGGGGGEGIAGEGGGGVLRGGDDNEEERDGDDDEDDEDSGREEL
eukprot:g3666.t1